jgi:alanyl-tRNA synthetase
VGVTMADAREAIQLAGIFEAKLHVASTLYGEELESHVKILNNELNGLQISAVKKGRFREQLANFSKQVLAYKKEKVSEMATEIVEKAVAEAATTESNKIVVRFDFGTDAKIAKSITTAYGKAVKDKALMLVSADTEGDKCLVVAFAPKNMTDIDCKTWVMATIEGTDGKGGGKQDSANFQVPGSDKADMLVEKALQYK